MAAQTADSIYRQACGPKDEAFDVRTAAAPVSQAPEPGKALVYFLMESSGYPTTRVGLDGAWVGALRKPSYISLDVTPGEHHACVSWQKKDFGRPRFVHFTAQAGKTYYYIITSIVAPYSWQPLDVAPADRDEALYLLGSVPISIGSKKASNSAANK